MSEEPNFPNSMSQYDLEMPHSVDAERCLLGSLMLNPALYLECIQTLKPSDFFLRSHRFIYIAIVDMDSQDIAVDCITICEELKTRNELEQCGGLAYIGECLDGNMREKSVKRYIQIIKGHAVRRQLIRQGNTLVNSALDLEEQVDDIMSSAAERLQQVTASSKEETEVSVSAANKAITKELMQSRRITGLRTCYRDLDFMLSGLEPGELTIIAARPGVGKTSFAMNILENVTRQQKHVLFVSLEMNGDSLLQRTICAMARVNFHAFREKSLTNEAWAKVERAQLILDEMDPFIHIHDEPDMKPSHVDAWTKTLSKAGRLDLIVVDYLQIMRPTADNDRRYQELGDITRDIRETGRKTRVPVIACCQMSRQSEQRTDHRPQLSDLRESGNIEQNADNVLFIYREEMYTPKPENRNVAEIIIGKQRNGPTGSVMMTFLKEFTRFESLYDEQQF